MKPTILSLLFCSIIASAGCPSSRSSSSAKPPKGDDASPSKGAKSVIGKWELQSDPNGFYLELTGDGKIVGYTNNKGKWETREKGTYKHEGDKLISNNPLNEIPIETYTVKKLTADELVLVAPKGGEMAFKRSK